MHYKKLSAYLFILGALIAILSSAFDVKPEMKGVNYIVMIIIGVFLGLMNKDDKDEVPFLVAAVVFMMASLAIIPVMSQYPILSTISKILFNLIVLVAPLAVVIALKLIMGFASQTEDERAAYKTKAHYAETLTPLEKIWNHVLVVTISLVFIMLVMTVFFKIDQYTNMMTVMDYLIMTVFIIDLGFLYKKSEDIHYFFHHYWLDIVAILPFAFVFRVAKFLRFAEILKTVSGSAFMTEQATVLERSLKFFSEEPALKIAKKGSAKVVSRAKNKKAGKKRRRKK